MDRSHKTPQRRPVERLFPDPAAGLTSAQAAERAEAGWHNRDDSGLSRTTGQIIRRNLCTFFNLLFLIFALCLFLVGAYRDMLFLGIIVTNTLIGIVQELRVRHTLDQIALVTARKAVVVRDGVPVTLPASQLVLDDIVLLTPGCQLCADAVLCDGAAEVNEALLTGEADPVHKRPGDRLLSGSFLISGKCAARLDRVGGDSYASTVAQEAKGRAPSRSRMMRALDCLLRIIGVAIVPLGTVMLTRQLLLMDVGLPYAVSSTVAAMAGMIPEGLYLLVSVALAVGVIDLSRRRTLVHELSSIENLARVDVLCLDKTGTITEEAMEVLETLPMEGVSGLDALLGAYVSTSTGDNATDQALRARFSGPAWDVVREVPFSSERKWSALELAGGTTWFLGAPEFLLGPGGGVCAEQLRLAANAGRRVLVLARGENLLDEHGALTGTPDPVGLVVLDHRLRPEAADTLRYFKEQGVAVKLISGDNAQAVAAVAQRAGVEHAGRWVDASALEDGADLGALAEETTVFGRVTPRQKRELIRGLQAAGHTVAMIGDGVNDVLALKDADCSVAMAAGSEAAQHVSQLVLLDSNFAVLPKVVREGRRVINNIQRSAALFLSKNIFSFVTALVLLFLTIPYPLLPAQISLMSALMIGAPSFLLTFEPSYERVKGGFLRSVLLDALPGGLTHAAVILTACVLGGRMGMEQEQLSTVCAILMGVVGLLVLLFLCWPLTPLRACLVAAMGIGYAGAVCFLAPLFHIAPLTPENRAFLCALALAAPAVMCLLVFLVSRVKAFLRAREQHRTTPAGSGLPAV